jgi:hypothetical protein
MCVPRERDRPGSRRRGNDRAPLGHSAGFSEITRVRLSGPGLGSPSEVGQSVTRSAGVELAEASEHLSEITFDRGGQRRVEDFRPALALIFRW